MMNQLVTSYIKFSAAQINLDISVEKTTHFCNSTMLKHSHGKTECDGIPDA